MLLAAIAAALVATVVSKDGSIITTSANGDLIINSSGPSRRIILNGMDVAALGSFRKQLKKDTY